MTSLTISIPSVEHEAHALKPDERMRVVVNINIDVLDAEVARRQVNGWLLDNVGNLLGATKPELIVGEPLLWRFDVVLGIPNLSQPGSGAMYRVGQIAVNAITGEVQDADTIAQELQENAAAVAR